MGEHASGGGIVLNASRAPAGDGLATLRSVVRWSGLVDRLITLLLLPALIWAFTTITDNRQRLAVLEAQQLSRRGDEQKLEVRLAEIDRKIAELAADTSKGFIRLMELMAVPGTRPPH